MRDLLTNKERRERAARRARIVEASALATACLLPALLAFYLLTIGA